MGIILGTDHVPVGAVVTNIGLVRAPTQQWA